MLPPNLSDEQRELLAQIGHFHLMSESHQNAANFCLEQIVSLRARLEQLEQNPEAQTHNNQP